MKQEEILETFSVIMKDELPKVKNHLGEITNQIQELNKTIQGNNSLFDRLHRSGLDATTILYNLSQTTLALTAKVNEIYERLYVVDDATMRAEILNEFISTLVNKYDIAPIIVPEAKSSKEKYDMSVVEACPTTQENILPEEQPHKKIEMSRQDFEELGMGAVPDPTIITEEKENK